MNKFLKLIPILLLTASCAHEPVSTTGGPPQSYNQSIDALNLQSSFAFVADGHEYYFVSARAEGYKNNCMRFDGYEDDKLKYSFAYDHFKELSGVYKSDITIDQKIHQVLKTINSFSPRLYACQPLPLQSSPSAMSTAMTYIIYGPMVVLVSPVVVPIMLSNDTKEQELIKKLRQIRLNQTYSQINELIKSHLEREETLEGYVIQSFDFSLALDSRYRRLVFIYKNQKLVAYVWGLKPQ